MGDQPPLTMEFEVELPAPEALEFAEKYDQHPAHLGTPNRLLPGDSVPGLYLIMKVLNELRRRLGPGVLCGTSMQIRWHVPVVGGDRVSVHVTGTDERGARRSLVELYREGVLVAFFRITHLMDRDAC